MPAQHAPKHKQAPKPALRPFYEHLDVNQPIDYAEGIIDRVTGQIAKVSPDENLLEVVVLDAGLFKCFDPINKYQAPFVEITIDGPEGRQVIETSTCLPTSEDPTDEEEEECSFRPTWNERFVFRAAGGVFVRFDVCIEHVVRNRTLCGLCAFTAEELWRRALDGRQLITIPLVHNKGGGWERDEELVGALRLVVGLMNMEIVDKLPKLDRHTPKLNRQHAHHFGHKDEAPRSRQRKEEEIVEGMVPQQQVQPMMMFAPQPSVQSMTMVPNPVLMQSTIPTTRSYGSIPMQGLQAMPAQSMMSTRSLPMQSFSVPSPSPVPVQSVPNLVPTSLAPISVGPQSGYITGPEFLY